MRLEEKLKPVLNEWLKDACNELRSKVIAETKMFAVETMSESELVEFKNIINKEIRRRKSFKI